MKILIVSDEESPALWEYYTPEKLADIDLIISCGDLDSRYLRFLVTMAHCPLLYVHGNHDGLYHQDPPEGCLCIEDQILVYNGIRILGLGGCRKYREGDHQYTEEEMRRRIRRLRWHLRRSGGVDIVVTHAPPAGVGDGSDQAHSGFAALRELLDTYRPRYLLHGHLHLRYGRDRTRERSYNGTAVINTSERYSRERPEGNCPESKRNRIFWKTRYREPYPG